MTYEAARRSVSRLWLRAFAGIVAVLAAALPGAASADVVSTNCNSSGAFSQEVNGRSPLRAFATDYGVYELDTSLKGVRVWQRGGHGLELLRPKGDDTFRPYTTRQIESTSPTNRPQRFTGIDAAGNGLAFKQPVGLAKHPTKDKFAVLSVGEYIDQGNNQYSPSVQVYTITNEKTGTDGALSSVELKWEAEYDNAFYMTTNGANLVLDRIYKYPDVLVVTNYYSDGSIYSVTTNTFVDYTYTTNQMTFVTNWVYVISADPPVTQTNAQSRTGLEDPIWWDPRNTSLFVDGFEYTILQTNLWVTVSTNYWTLTNWVWKYSTTTNASYLSSGTDVAFLGDSIVVSLASEVFRGDRTGFLVFTDASSPGKRYVADDLDRNIRGIDVDKNTGDVYATVPDLAAVFRYQIPTSDTNLVYHDDFVAGVTNFPGSDFGLLSHPDDVSVWYPDSAGPILLVADTANGRVQGFDPNATWTATNWLGSTYVQALDPVDLSTWTTTNQPGFGVPFNGEEIGFVVTTNTVPVRKQAGLQYYTVLVDVVTTNFYRLEQTAFPLFAVGESGVDADPLIKPRGATGVDGESVFAVADTAAHRVRLYGVDLAGLDSDDVLALAVWWPGAEGAWSGLSVRDLAVTNGSSGGSVVWVDAPHTNALGGTAFQDAVLSGSTLFVQEHETWENELHFTVAPARSDRTFTLSVPDGNGVVAPATGTVTIPAGETEGVFTFTAKDGIVTTEETVSWRDRYGNAVSNGAPTAAYAVTNRYAVLPAYTLSIASGGGYSTNATLAVANVDPVITNALFRGYVVHDDPPYVMVQGLIVHARDWVDADADLRYLWWATTNLDWAAKNLDWAVTNNDWASSASDSWTEGPEFEAAQTVTASELTGEAGSDVVTNKIALLVAVGNSVDLPLADFGIDADAVYAEVQPGASPVFVVCTVLDKDGGAAIITFPTPHEPTETADKWGLEGGYSGGGGGGGGEQSDAVYAARFTGIEENYVKFVVTLETGTPAKDDTVSLEYATELGGPWKKLGMSQKVGDQFVADRAAEYEITISNVWSGNVRFFRVVRP
jgi:hypothetical protein